MHTLLYSSPTAAVPLTYTQRQIAYATPVQVLHTQTHAVAYRPKNLPVRSQGLSLRHRGRTMRWTRGIVRCCRRGPCTETYGCFCEPEFDSAFLKSRQDALDFPSTLGIRVTSPLACGRNGVPELLAQKWHVLGDGGRGSILTASTFPSVQCDRGTCCGRQRQQYELMLYKYILPGTWYV